MIKKVKELLESGAITQEVADQLNGEWTAHTKVLNDENKDLRTKNEDLSKNFDQLSESNTNLEAELAGLDTKIEQAKKDGQIELQKQLEGERTSKQELQTSLESFKKANQDLTIENNVQKALADFETIDAEVVAGHIKQRVAINDDGKVIYKDGENQISLEDGVKSFFESKPNLLKAVGDGGSGAGGDGASGGAKTSNFVGDTTERKSAIQSMIDADK